MPRHRLVCVCRLAGCNDAASGGCAGDVQCRLQPKRFVMSALMAIFAMEVGFCTDCDMSRITKSEAGNGALQARGIRLPGGIAMRYAVFAAGLYFLSLGIVLIVRSALGTTPISSINYVVSLHTPLTLGVCTFLINMLLIAGQFWMIRGSRTRRDVVEILLQIPFSFLFSAFIDLNMSVTEGLAPSGYAMSVLLLALGCLMQAVGVVLELKPGVAMMSAEAFVRYAARRYDKDFGRFKVGFDVTLVTGAVLLSLIVSHRVEGVREGSLIAAVCTGHIVGFLNNKVMTRRMLSRLHLISAPGHTDCRDNG